MERTYLGRRVELLAPAGTPEALRALVSARCDALYVGGKAHNMRLMRKGQNFTDAEVAEAAALAKGHGKRLYVTVNAMLDVAEAERVTDYLHELERAGVDAVIVQDTAVLERCREAGLTGLRLHASVMMNVHSAATAAVLRRCGVARVTLSREIDLRAAERIQRETGLETEYFVHGDLCSVNGANCYYSAVVFGESANRGRCHKPCRWPYRESRNGALTGRTHVLAARDMCLYGHLPELLEARVTSLKIEGRTRDPEFLVGLVNAYGEALDRFLADPAGFDRQEGWGGMEARKRRSFTTAYAFGPPGPDYAGVRCGDRAEPPPGEKTLSLPRGEPALDARAVEAARERLGAAGTGQAAGGRPRLSVKVNGFAQAEACFGAGAGRVYLPGEAFEPAEPVTEAQLESLGRLKGAGALYLELPHFLDDAGLDAAEAYLAAHGRHFDGLLVPSLGAADRFRGRFALTADFNLNVFNHEAIRFQRRLGIGEVTVSLESKAGDLRALMAATDAPLELIVHGPLTVMYTSHDLLRAAGGGGPAEGDELVLTTDENRNPVRTDRNRRSHVLSERELCLLPLLDALAPRGPLGWRIEGQTYSPEALARLVAVYRRAAEERGRCGELFAEMEAPRAGFTLGALSY